MKDSADIVNELRSYKWINVMGNKRGDKAADKKDDTRLNSSQHRILAEIRNKILQNPSLSACSP